MSKVLFVSISIGKHYTDLYNKVFRKSQQLYAKKCNYDFLVLNYYIDMKYQYKQAISFNKILTCSTQWSSKYDYVLFVDADIIINSESPPIHNYIDYGDKIGIIDEFS